MIVTFERQELRVTLGTQACGSISKSFMETTGGSLTVPTMAFK